jgi:regulatory protein
MAQSWRVKPKSHKKPRPPLDGEALERLALFYVGRYATTKAKLAAYLARKVQERGWSDENRPPIEPLVQRMAELGYIDDGAFAAARAASLQRRGYGERRIAQSLKAAGIDEGDAAPARQASREGAFEAALRFAERKRIGPFAAEEPDRRGRERAFAAMMRAGHPLDLARRILSARLGEVPEQELD